MENVCIKNLGCLPTGMKLNLHTYFRLNGFGITKNISEADYIVVVTCASMKRKEDLSINYILNVVKRKKRKTAKIVVAGCLPAIDRERLTGEADIIQVEKELDLDKIFMSSVKLDEMESYHLFSDAYEDFDLAIYNTLFRRFRLWKVEFPSGKKLEDFCGNFFILILKLFTRTITHKYLKAYFILPNSGCSGKCSYCVQRYAIGGVRSKPIDNLIEQLNDGLAKGFKFFMILSTSLSDYGIDIKSSFLDLLNAFTNLKQDYQLQLVCINPAWIVQNIDEFLKILERKKIIGFSSSIQSGSQRILDLMNRPYDIKKVMQCFQLINARFPRLKIYTEVIVGFPTETEDDFLETLSLLKSVKFSDIRFYGYSEMPNALSMKIPYKVADKIIKKRVKLFERKFMTLVMKSWIEKIIFDFTYDFGTACKNDILTIDTRTSRK